MPSDDGSSSTGRTRSKSGCLTCRQRRKKCDETHSDEHGGACQRCIQGAWRCEWPAPAGQGPVRVFERGAKSRARQERIVSLTAEPTQDAAPPAVPTQLPAAAFANALGPFSSSQPVASTSTAGPPPAVWNTPAAPPAAAAADPARLPANFLAAQPTTFAPPGLVSHHLATSPFLPVTTVSTASSLPAHPTAHGDLAGLSVGPDDFWLSIDSQFGANARVDSNSAVAAEAAHGMPTEPEEALDRAYDSFFVAHLYALDEPLRKAVLSQIRSIVTSSKVCRHAALATSTLLRLHVLREAPRDASLLVTPSADEQEERRLRAKADEYYQRGLEHLSQQSIPISAKMLALYDLWLHQFVTVGAEAASFLLLLGDVYALELGPRPTVQLHPVTLPEQVIITITAWEDCIRCATTARRRPFFRFPNLPGEPLSSSSPALRDSVNDVRTEIPTLGYMPAGLVLCIAAIANLSVDMDALPDAVVKAKATAIEQAVRSWRPLPPLNGIESAAFVEQTSTCEMWRHAIVIYLYQVIHRHGPMSSVLSASVQQILKIGAPLLSRFQPGRVSDIAATFSPAAAASPSSATTPASVAVTVAVDTPTADESSIASAAISLFSPNARAVPFFLAGTCAMTPVERRTCVAGIRSCGDDKGYADDVRALERIWERQRADGWARPWREVLEAEGLHVVFL